MVDIIEKVTSKDTQTLAISTALLLSTTIANFKAAILLTYVRLAAIIQWPDVGDKLIIGLAYGDATIAQIAAALVNATVDTEKTQDYRENQVSQRAIIDIWAPPPPAAAGLSTTINWKPRLPAKGLPANASSGFQFFAFNISATANFTDGPTLLMIEKWIFARLS